MELVFVSHATTKQNEQSIHQGWNIQGDLSEKGRLEIELLSYSLKNEKFDYAVISPLKRCYDTYLAIKKFHPYLKFEKNDGIRSKKSGIYEGKRRDLVNNILKKENIPIYKFKPSGGESTIELQKRIFDFLENYVVKLSLEKILLVSHGGVITTIGLYIYNYPFEKYEDIKISKASITRINYQNNKFEIKDWNNTNHLN